MDEEEKNVINIIIKKDKHNIPYAKVYYNEQDPYNLDSTTRELANDIKMQALPVTADGLKYSFPEGNIVGSNPGIRNTCNLVYEFQSILNSQNISKNTVAFVGTEENDLVPLNDWKKVKELLHQIASSTKENAGIDNVVDIVIKKDENNIPYAKVYYNGQCGYDLDYYNNNFAKYITSKTTLYHNIKEPSNIKKVETVSEIKHLIDEFQSVLCYNTGFLKGYTTASFVSFGDVSVPLKDKEKVNELLKQLKLSDKKQDEDKKIKYHRIVVKYNIAINDVFTLRIGEHIFDDSYFKSLKETYPDSYVEIPMSEIEWLRYLSDKIEESNKKLSKLKYVKNQLGIDLYDLNDIPANIENIDILPTAVLYIENVEFYENELFRELYSQSKTNNPSY